MFVVEFMCSVADLGCMRNPGSATGLYSSMIIKHAQTYLYFPIPTIFHHS